MSELLKKMQDTLEHSCLEAYALGKREKQSEIDKLKAEKEEVIKLAEKWMAMVNGDFGLTERLTAYNYGSELMRIFKKPNSKNVGG